MVIDTPLLVTGHGPAGLVVAKVVSGWGLQSLVAGHQPLDGDEPVVLDPEAVAVLTPHGVFDVLRPYLASVEPPSIAPVVFEEVLKHHCVADMNVTVYDGIELVERVAARRPGVCGRAQRRPRPLGGRGRRLRRRRRTPDGPARGDHGRRRGEPPRSWPPAVSRGRD